MADPANLVVVVVDNDAALSWDGSPTPNVADYSVFRRSPSTGAVFNPAGTPVASGVTSLTYGDNNLPAGTYDWQVFGRVVAATVAPTITSPNNTSFTGGTVSTFTVTATGTPTPTLSMTGTLPAGVTFVAATGVLSGTPSAVGTFPLVFTAANGTLPNAVQNFTLTVTGAAPAITSANATSFTNGTAGTFTVTKTGTPTPTLSMTGTLPAGVTFVAATGVLAGTPTASGTFPLVFTAANGITPNAVQNFTLTVAAAAPPFVPTDLPNLAGWWDASDAGSITASAGAVSEWRNKTPAAPTATHEVQATASNQPITGTRTINSKNVLDFDGTNDTMRAIFATALTQPVTIFAVVQTDVTGATKSVIEYPLLMLYMNAGKYAYYANTVVDGTGSWDTNPHVICGVFNGASSGLWVDGGLQTSGNPGSGATSDIFLTGSTGYWNGAIAEIVIYRSALGTTDRQTVELYLRNKWGTP